MNIRADGFGSKGTRQKLPQHYGLCDSANVDAGELIKSKNSSNTKADGFGSEGTRRKPPENGLCDSANDESGEFVNIVGPSDACHIRKNDKSPKSPV